MSPVLTDTPPVSSHNDYSLFSLKSSSPDAMDCGSTITSLQPPSHRYDPGYSGSGGNWGGSCTAPASHNYNNYYNGTPQAPPSQGYPPIPPPPPMMLPPFLYSTVNQNQIHLHLHHNEGRPEYAEDVGSMVQNNLTISGSGPRAIEIGILQQNQLAGEDPGRQQNDPSFWRPY